MKVVVVSYDTNFMYFQFYHCIFFLSNKMIILEFEPLISSLKIKDIYIIVELLNIY